MNLHLVLLNDPRVQEVTFLFIHSFIYLYSYAMFGTQPLDMATIKNTVVLSIN